MFKSLLVIEEPLHVCLAENVPPGQSSHLPCPQPYLNLPSAHLLQSLAQTLTLSLPTVVVVHLLVVYISAPGPHDCAAAL